MPGGSTVFSAGESAGLGWCFFTVHSYGFASVSVGVSEDEIYFSLCLGIPLLGALFATDWLPSLSKTIAGFGWCSLTLHSFSVASVSFGVREDEVCQFLGRIY